MRTIHVNITGMFVQKDCKNGGVQGEGNATQLHITFDETWKGYGKRVIWRNAQGENPVAVVLIAAAAAGTADTLTYDTPIPAEALALPGWCSFTVEGFQDAETASAMFSVRDVLQVMENDGANSPAEPTPSESQQILDAIAKNEEAVGAYAKESKSWAVGGTESREGEDTDNAMYYAQQAEASRKDASESAKSASVSAGSAAASAAAAAGSKAAADKSAGVAKDSAILSQSWAVGDTGTREGENTDNARYWAQQAHMAAGGGVVSFNGRTGSVIPKKGDYTAADVGAAPEGYGLGGAAKRLTSEDDLNNIWENGWYFWGSDKPANAPKMNPGGAADSYIFMRVTNYDFQNVLQEYWSLNQNSQNQARRINRNGTWGLLEWYNPPMQIGVEYRTTERFNGKPVYAQLVNCGALEARTMKTVMLKIPVDWVVSCTGMQGPNTNRHRQASPFYYNNGSAELVFYCSAEAYHYETEDNLYVYLYATQATTASYALVKYTKESD